MWNELRIEKSRLPAVLTTTDGVKVSGEIFVQTRARSRLGYESAPDLLNAPEPYFPLSVVDGGIRLVSKRQVRELIVAAEAVEEPDWIYETAIRVRIHMADGAMHEGTVLIEQQTARSRVLDFLNRATCRFISVFCEEGVILVNREFIAWVEEAPE